MLGVSDLGFKDIGCDACALLKSGPPEQTLTFALYRNNNEGMKAFLHSYLTVQTDYGPRYFCDGVLTASNRPGRRARSPLPAGCGPRKICIQTNNCDKPVGGSCNVCT